MSGTDDDVVAEASKLGAADTCCASCGKSELDDVKLTECDGCDLVRYCSDTCKEDNRPMHEVKCKERAVELRDEILFRQPESTHLGDCPICCLPFPLDNGKLLYSCCSKYICIGCQFANMACRGLEEEQLMMGTTCPFCRDPMRDEEEINVQKMRRVEANDPVAMREMGLRHFGEVNFDAAFKLFERSAELGDAEAHYKLGHHYKWGKGVEMDEKKALYHVEEAAIRGHSDARFVLTLIEGRDGTIERSVKHLIIVANFGHDHAIQALRECYKDGDINKEGFAAALRAHHAAVNAMKSPDREIAKAIQGLRGQTG